MAEDNDSSQEKSEQPTPKRLADAKRKGQVPRSRELNTVLILLVGATVLLLFGGFMAMKMGALATRFFTFERDLAFDSQLLLGALTGAMGSALLALMPLFFAVVVAAIFGQAVTGGIAFSGEAIGLKLDKLDPIKGLKRIFSAKGLMELFKALAKFGLVIAAAIFLLWGLSDRLLGLGTQSVETALAHVGWIVAWTFLMLSAALLLVAAIDVPFQLWSHQKQLRMTKQQVRDEMKDTEGKPEVKSKIRQLQYQMAQQRMMAAVPTADVVVTNPTHFAVALKYDQKKMRAPKVVARGVDLVALQIREIAKENKVPMFAAPPLARALYFSTQLDQEIPAGLYIAVARVLAYIYQVKNVARRGQGAAEKPTDLPIPDEFLRPSVQ